MSRKVRAARSYDGALLKHRRQVLRRQHGDPRRRADVLVQWIVSVNVKRGVVPDAD